MRPEGVNLSSMIAERYSRRILLEDVGPEGQLRLAGYSVLVVGAGALGSSAILSLAAAGTGRVGIADGENVEISNLQRQYIHTETDIGRNKAVSASEKVRALNRNLCVDTYDTRVGCENAESIIGDYDFICDCTDSFSSKHLINDICVLTGKPFSHAGVRGFEGQCFTYIPGAPCLRCMIDFTAASGGEPGPEVVFGPLPSLLGSIQAAEALKYRLGAGEVLAGRVLGVNIRDVVFREVSFEKESGCPVCSEKPRITGLEPERYVCL